MQFELWEDERSHTLIPANSEQYRKHLTAAARLIWTVEADSFEAALAAMHERLGWKPYEPWRPHRYEVAVHTGYGEVFTYRTTTWLGERKAIALAAIEHDHCHSAEPRRKLNNVLITDLGALELTDDGTADVPNGDIFDQSEGLQASER